MSATRCPASPSVFAFSPTQAAVEPPLFGRLMLFGRLGRDRFSLGRGSFGPRRFEPRAAAAAPPARPINTAPAASAGAFAFWARPSEFPEPDALERDAF